MSFDQTRVPLKDLITLFSGLLVIGIGLTIPLFKFNYRKFLKSGVFVKIFFWIPIFLFFLGVLYASNPVRFILLILLLSMSLREFMRVFYSTKYRFMHSLYFLLFAVALLHLCFIGIVYRVEFINLLVTLCLATVIADVTAFFFGNYLGIHKLPVALNKNKSWEGVLGQVVGALLGVILVNTYIEPVISMWIFLPIGIGSALGDLANSFAKRKANIHDWSNAIPGHGGFIDRLSSIAGSATLVFYFLKIHIG